MNETLTISCDLDNLKYCREFVREFLQKHLISEILQNQLVLAVDEVIANLIIHSNKQDDSKHVKLTLEKLTNGVEFKIRDQGESFRLGDYKEPDIPTFIRERKKGGVGIALVNKIMDEVEFKHETSFNVCRMFKKI